MNEESLDNVCQYNGGVICEDRNRCKACGWRPFVSACRITEIKRRRSEAEGDGETVPPREAAMPEPVRHEGAGMPGEV